MQQNYDFSQRITSRREQLGLSREEVAEQTGAKLSYIRHLEETHEMPDIGFISRLAQTLGTSIAYLTGRENEPPEPS